MRVRFTARGRLLAIALGAGLAAGCGGGGGGPSVLPIPPVAGGGNEGGNGEGGGGATGGNTPPPEPLACADLASRFESEQDAVVIVSATDVAQAQDLPAHCDVRGTIRGNIKFAVFMPKEWNGRFQMVGNGGKAGSISFSAMESALRQGYATSSTDTGHDASIRSQSGARFGYDAEFGRDMEIDFGYRAVHLTALVSKEIVNAHYPEKIQYSYWNGCSTGGRQGLMEAQRFPEDFDGYAVGAPVYNYTRQQMSAPALLQHLYKSGIAGGSVISPAKRDLIGNIVYNGNGGNYPGCDALDGVKDGQIRNPLRCNFDPLVHVPMCGPSGGADCLTAEEQAALVGVYKGRPDVSVLALPVGSENTQGGWPDWLITNGTRTPQLHTVMADAFQYLLFEPDRPDFDYLTQFDWSADPHRMETAKQTYNATNPDLRRFAEAGKKIIMYHGWTDPGVNPMGTLEYRANVESVFGSPAAVERFMKLYMVPGMGHCSGGPGHGSVDWVAPLKDWVEHGKEPQAIVGSKPGTQSTRPHCPYPQEAAYDGQGNVDDAQSYSCATPG
ncbi:tannase/feruloyl esterase family alpha/beta hydrolase [Pseudacidovorax intermedius]|uniref:tannase/feruloyl esterase family alpha/beta hydrolase n=1 Tax=Pseudacidovorax intermedius TaxID=433924 RepID=UPI0026F34178|nr:tannase/feruloyl esterase family alpha/beta hydrolase [Pseudacidovorax intermedius]